MAFSQAFGSLLFLALSYQFGIEIRLFALTYLKLAFSTSRRTHAIFWAFYTQNYFHISNSTCGFEIQLR